MKARWVVAVASIALGLFGLTLPATADTVSATFQPAAGLQPISQHQEYSSNWSGYAVEQSETTFDNAAGSWVQPTGTCDKNNYQLAAFFVGIDGYNSGSVEQIGTDVDCVHGSPVYYAWWEMYPDPAHTIDACPITAGATIAASVSYVSGSTFHLTMSVNSVVCYNQDQVAPGTPDRSSAEWIAEAPATGGHFWPLTNFGTVNFSAGSAGSDSPSAHSGDIADGAWDAHEIIMAKLTGPPFDPRVKATHADPEGSLSGGAFHVDWVSS